MTQKISMEDLPLPSINRYSMDMSQNWESNQASERNHISLLIKKIFNPESKQFNSSEATSLEEDRISLSVLERLKNKQKNLFSVISNVFLEPQQNAEDAVLDKQETCDFQKWEKRGYKALVKKLQEHKDYPWDDIKKINHPILMEQLIDLIELCQFKSISLHVNENILSFALEIAKIATLSNLSQNYLCSQEILESTKQLLGQFIYLINKDPELALKCLVDNDLNETSIKINSEFNKAIQEIEERLTTHYDAHAKTGLQSADVAWQTRLPFEIARFIMSAHGTINVGIIDIFSELFLCEDDLLINYETNLGYALKILKKSPQIRGEFAKIRKPSLVQAPSQDIIRACLNLSNQEVITDYHARLTVLTALLSHLRQGSSGSCFATSLAIEILSAHLAFCLKDLTQLIQEDKLTRVVKGVKKGIPPLRRINDPDLAKTFILDQEGSLFIDNQMAGFIWEAPGVQAACQAIGISSLKEAILAILKKGKFPIKMDFRELLKQLCLYLAETQPLKKNMLGALFAQGCFAFSSQTNHPLLKVWENAIAGMAEAQDGSMIKSNILEATIHVIKKYLRKVNDSSSLQQKVEREFNKSFYNRIQLRYDPAIVMQGVKDLGDGHSKEGAFVLYDGNQRIDTSKGFIEVLLKTVSEMNPALGQTEEGKLILEKLKDIIRDESFIPTVLTYYHPSNEIVKKLKNYENLPFTPWITRIGNNSKMVLEVYLETSKPLKTERLAIKTPKQLLAKIIELGKTMSEEEKSSYLSNPNKLTPIRIPGNHTFSLMLGNPSLAKAWKENCLTEKWIKKYVLQPGQQIAESQIDPATKEKFISYLAQEVLPHLFLNEEKNQKIEAFVNLANKLEDTSIKKFRTQLLEILRQLYSVPNPPMDGIARQFDTVLCESLEPKLKKKLRDSAVHFADTNWCSGIHDIHFCFAVNPGTGDLEIWEAYANGSHFLALDQKYYQEVEFFFLPQDLLPDDPFDHEYASIKSLNKKNQNSY
jgi:hypothetical protein